MERCESCVCVRGLSHCEFDVSMWGVECMTRQSTERLVTVTRESGEVRRARVSLEPKLESTLDRGCVLLCPSSAFCAWLVGCAFITALFTPLVHSHFRIAASIQRSGDFSFFSQSTLRQASKQNGAASDVSHGAFALRALRRTALARVVPNYAEPPGHKSPAARVVLYAGSGGV